MNLRFWLESMDQPRGIVVCTGWCMSYRVLYFLISVPRNWIAHQSKHGRRSVIRVSGSVKFRFHLWRSSLMDDGFPSSLIRRAKVDITNQCSLSISARIAVASIWSLIGSYRLTCLLAWRWSGNLSVRDNKSMMGRRCPLYCHIFHGCSSISGKTFTEDDRASVRVVQLGYR